MNILRASGLGFALGHVKLLDGVDFLLDENERVGLIGRNGTGKSSFLKILAREIEPDDGTLDMAQSLRAVYLPQESDFGDAKTSSDVLGSALGEAHDLMTKFDDLTARIDAINSGAGDAKDGDLKALLKEQSDVHARLDAIQGWDATHKIQYQLEQLSLKGDELVENLSGGQIKKLALAWAFIQEPNLLLLDEPTNHLDIDAIEWLENRLTSFPGTIIFISHDRRFLDTVATRIDELDRGILRSYPGNFSRYQTLKSKELEDEEKANRRFDKFHAQEEAWIRKGVEARRTRDEGRVKRLEELRKIRKARRESQGSVEANISESAKSGKIIAHLENVGFVWPDGKKIIEDFSLTLQRGARLGLIGPNGAGKTTFIKLLLGELEPTSGKLVRGTKQNIIYFDQLREGLNPEATVYDTIADGNDYVEVAGVKRHVMSHLSSFLFDRERARSPVKSLSGGERNRLLLAKLFTKPSNIIVLDEPTNDLDIDTQEILEEILQNYQGSILLVSHDRYFLDNIVTESVVFEGDGKLTYYIGGYEDYKITKKREEEIKKEREQGQQQAQVQNSGRKDAKGQQGSDSTSDSGNTWRTKEVKLSYKEKKELEELPALLEKIENEIDALNNELMDGSIYRDNPEKAVEINKRVQELTEELDAKTERWEELELKNEESKKK